MQQAEIVTQYPIWQAVAALDIITELMILVFPTVALCAVHMSKTQRLRTLALLDCRIL
jgi:hypothetical protein